MDYRQLGRSDARLPEVGLGTWGYHGGRGPIEAGIAAGAWFIDTAESYETEAVVGEVIHGIRDKVFVATKVSKDHLRSRDLKLSLDASLKRLRSDYVDLYQVHEPNPEIPLEETLGTMEELADAGKVRFIGVSNFEVEQLKRAQAVMRRHAIVSNQVRYNIADRTIEAGLLSYCQSQGITVLAYSPLGRELQRLVDCDPSGVLQSIAQEAGKTIPQVALNWCLSRDRVVVIPKGNSIEHVVENCGASGWKLTSDQVARLNEQVAFRRRSAAEMALRRLIPSGAAATVKRLVKALPPSLRRRLE